jgi:uncharacterized membrane protein YphA (DoxX/SURF4 family)
MDDRSVNVRAIETNTSAELPPPRVARWIAATLCILYGFAKINGSQFTILDSELSKPLGQVSGFWLTWYYFGHSAVYGTLIALLEIVAGVLLIMPRTALLGALVLLPIVTNIVLIDVFYGIDLGGTVAAVVILLCVWLTIEPYARRLRKAILLETLPMRPAPRALIALCLVSIGAFAFTWWVANYNNRAPTSIDGIWSVRAQSNGTATVPQWRTVFFERNRAAMAVFRTADGIDATHHFEITKNGLVQVWQTWLTKGPLIMQGRQQADGQLELVILEPSGGGHLTLQRASMTGLKPR